MFETKINPFSGHISSNCIRNLLSCELGVLKPISFIHQTNSTQVDRIRLAKYRSIASLKFSATWLGLESVENRL